MFKNKLDYKLLNILLLMGVIYLLYLTSDKWGGFLGQVVSVAFPFLVAFAVAYVLYPFVKWLEDKGVRKKIAVGFISLLVIVALALLIGLTLPLVYDQLVLLSRSVIQFLADVSEKFDVELGAFSDTIVGALNTVIQNVGTYVSNGTIDILNKGVSLITNLMIIVIVAIYFLSDMDKIREKIKRLLKRTGKKEYLYVKKLDHEIGNYFHGLAIFMVIQFIEYSLLFWVIHHPNWLLLGLLACVTTIIPYFGGYITNIIAVITASVISVPLCIATLVICLVFPNIDGYVISPKIYGKTNNINPVMVIFSIGLGGSLFGFVGIVMALPVYILLKASYDYYEEDIKRTISNVKDSID